MIFSRCQAKLLGVGHMVPRFLGLCDPECIITKYVAREYRGVSKTAQATSHIAFGTD